MSVEYPVHIKTRQTAVTTATTNSSSSSNKAAALTNGEMDMNLLNLKKAIDTVSTHYYVAHNTDGTIKPSYLQSNVHYVEDVSTTANQLQINSNGVITSLTAGVTLFVKVNTLNTGASTIQVTNTATTPDTVLGGGAKSILKNKDVALKGGELKEDEIVILNYDGSNWQVVGESAGILDNQTVGSVISFDSTGKPVVVAPGTTGQVLTATTDAPPTFTSGGASGGWTDYNFGVIPSPVTRANSSSSTVAASTANINDGSTMNLSRSLRIKHGMGTVPKHLKAYLKCISNSLDVSTHHYPENAVVYFPHQIANFNNESNYMFQMFSDVNYISYYLHGNIKLHYRPFSDSTSLANDPLYDADDIATTVKGGADFPLSISGYGTITYAKWELHILAKA